MNIVHGFVTWNNARKKYVQHANWHALTHKVAYADAVGAAGNLRG